MELNGKDDYFARWLQGICAIVLFGVLLVIVRLIRHLDPSESREFDWLVGAAVTLTVLVARCGWYAITGGGNINRDILNANLGDVLPRNDD